MPIKFACPNCQVFVMVADEHAGRTGKCQNCHKPVTVPLASNEMRPSDFDQRSTAPDVRTVSNSSFNREKQYEVSHGTQRLRPLTATQITALLHAGEIATTDMVTDLDAISWKQLSEHDDFRSVAYNAGNTADSVGGERASRRSSASSTADAQHDVTPRADVSSKWRERFRILEKAGPFSGLTYRNSASLSLGERMKIGLNIWAFLFSILYYIAKGMPRKGLVLLGVAWLLAACEFFIEGLSNVSVPDYILPAGMAGLFGGLASYDYYRKVVHGDTIWQPLYILGNNAALLLFLCMSFGLLWYSSPFGIPIGSSADIEFVRNGILDFDKSTTVGEAFENYDYFNSVRWNAFETDNGRDVVEVRGEVDMSRHPLRSTWESQGVTNVAVLFQFTIHRDGERFDIQTYGLQIGDKVMWADDLGLTQWQLRMNLQEIYNNTPFS